MERPPLDRRGRRVRRLLVKRFLSADDRERIKGAIESAEKMTAGEIHVRVVSRSVGLPWVLSIALGLLSGLGAWLGGLEWMATAVAGLTGVGLGILFIPRSRRAKERAVWSRARREFDRVGMPRTGVLVLLSVHEHGAVILAEKEINDVVPPETWDREVKAIIDGIKSGEPGDGIVAAVGEIGALLARHFPRRDDDRNELPDEVKVR